MEVRITGMTWEPAVPAADPHAQGFHRASLDEAKHPIVIGGSLPDVVEFFYTDERSRLGHYLEHVWLSPATLEMMAQQIPNYPA